MNKISRINLTEISVRFIFLSPYKRQFFHLRWYIIGFGVFKLVVYADVLIFLNLIINYFLLLTVSKIIRKECKMIRIILSAFSGAVASLYIFLPPLSFWLEGLLKTAVCVIMCIIAFGFKDFRVFIKNVLLLFIVTLGFGGAMYGVWLLFKPRGMVINNSVVYFDISVISLIAFSVIGYVLFSVFFKIFSRSSPLAKECEITVFLDGKSLNFSGIVDTGNSIEDVFSQGEIIICDETVKAKLFSCEDIKGNAALKTRYRLLPCSTISGADMLEGVRCDKAVIKTEKQTITLKKPILAFSKTPLADNNAIINPKILG